jgi:hypothetical protein
MSRASDLANLIASGSTTIHGEAGVTSSDSTGKTTNLQQGLAKAWINFDGSATGAVGDYDRDSFNCSVITDHGSGSFTLGFTNTFGNANYAGAGMSGSNGTSFGKGRVLFINHDAPTTSVFRVHSQQCNDGTNTDDPQIHIMFTGDLV